MGWFFGVPTTNANSRPGSLATTVHLVQYVGPRPLRLTCPRKRAPTSGPCEPSIHSASKVSGLKRPVLVTSLTSCHTASGGASTCTVTESVGTGRTVPKSERGSDGTCDDPPVSTTPYDEIGRTYGRTRREDPRVAAIIRS